ncbi:MAG TPA: 4Fe-4S double cluster binding domain-containing protein [Nitrospirota bacterium]|nr:4Fe-4S double cluster binding domain-containing protein [Nitrospirota bacterium]
MNRLLKKDLLDHGAAVVGYAGLRGFLSGEIAHLETAVSIGVDRRLNEDTLSLLMKLQKRGVRFLKSRGYRTLAIPPDSDRKKGTFISKLYSLFNHKMAATSAGLGWIGKNGLLISTEYGPRLSLVTVLTDAPLEPDTPMEYSLCGDCRLCMQFCPSQAITGSEWSRSSPFAELVKTGACRSHKASKRATDGKPNCGLCINICPYGRTIEMPESVKHERKQASDKTHSLKR